MAKAAAGGASQEASGSTGATQTSTTRGSDAALAFAFVQELAVDLSKGGLQLPSYPTVALRVQRILADSGADAERVVRVIGVEPVLAARILAMANSVALAPQGRAVTDLRTAVGRLGFDALRTAAIGFALTQLRQAPAYRGIEKQLTELWQQGVALAATCYVLARSARRFSADTAMLCGLVAGVGKLYILTRSKNHPELFADAQAYQDIVREWHANVARAVLEDWGVGEEIVTAVHTYEGVADETRTLPQLADVLSVAATLADFQKDPEQLLHALAGNRAVPRLGLDTQACQALLGESAAELAALRSALG